MWKLKVAIEQPLYKEKYVDHFRNLSRIVLGKTQFVKKSCSSLQRVAVAI
jgi:hypothetical protein